MELTPEEIRVLGALAEKEATTPDNYPLSSNALVNACNQSTNRDLVVHYTERDVDQVMLALREQGLARTVRGDGQRVHKHKHILREALDVSSDELAVLSVLMLRGAQTAAELRARTERYAAGPDPLDTERLLHALGERDEPLVRVLERRPGERESRWVHLLGGEERIPRPDAPAGAVSARAGDRADEVSELRARVDELERRFAVLLDRLGESIE